MRDVFEILFFSDSSEFPMESLSVYNIVPFVDGRFGK